MAGHPQIIIESDEKKRKARERHRAWAAKNREHLRVYRKKWVEQNKEQYTLKQRAARRAWRKANPNKAREEKIRWRARHRDKYLALARNTTRTYRLKYPYKKNAQLKVWRAKKKGVLVPMPCAICGNADSSAHHCDYRYPLDVMWLCQGHHDAWHRVFKTEDQA